MTRLILLNGPPGIGKSTLAARYADERPLSMCLDIDLVRRQLGGWRNLPTDSGRLARSMALAMARTHLTAAHDVVVPQFLARPPFIESLELLAAETGCEFHEIVLMDSRDNAILRFNRRLAVAQPLPQHVEAALDAGGDAGLAEMFDRLEALVRHRPSAKLLYTTAGDIESSFNDLLTLLG